MASDQLKTAMGKLPQTNMNRNRPAEISGEQGVTETSAVDITEDQSSTDTSKREIYGRSRFKKRTFLSSL
jgi:hypothetical protein